MKFIVNTAQLLKKLQQISGAISSRSTLPILDYFLFEIDGKRLQLTSSDLEISMRTSLEVEAREPGRIAVPSRMILDTLKSLSEQPVTFDINEQTRQIEITTDTGKYKIVGENGSDYPKFPVIEDTSAITLPANLLTQAIYNTIFSIGQDDLRPGMTGLYMQLMEKELRFVATDGNRLVMYKSFGIAIEKEDNVLLPRKLLNLLKNSLPSTEEPIAIEYSKLNVRFVIDDLEIVGRLIDERFPDYRAVVSPETPNKLTLDCEKMLRTLKRTMIYANKTTNQVRLKITGDNVQVKAEDTLYNNEAVETIKCDYDGEDMEIGFNARYLIEMLSIVETPEAVLSMSEHNRPGVLTPTQQGNDEELMMLLMPIVINLN